MIEKIKALEKEALKLEPGEEQREDLLHKVSVYANKFLNEIDTKKAYTVTEDRGKALLDAPLSEKPQAIDEVIRLIEEQVDKPGLNPASGGHLGYVPGGGVYSSALGDYLAAVSNRYAGVFFASPGAVRMENMMIRWMCDLVGYPGSSLGNLTSGGSLANLTAVVAARDNKKIKADKVSKAVIYLSEQVHHCLHKSFHFSGLSEAVIRYIPLDENYRMKAGELEKQIREDQAAGLLPFLVVSSAGTTDTGAIDPLDEIAAIAGRHDLWNHVDAAYGGFFLLTREGKKKLKGIEKSDSVAIDPHKGLFLAYGTGAVLVRNGRQLYESNHFLANYMQDTFDATEEPSPADLSPELTKHFRGMRMWLSLKLFGLKPFRAGLEEKLMLTRYFRRELNKRKGYETGPEPDLSITFFRYVPENGDADEFNKRLTREIKEDGKVFLSSTSIDGIFYIRLAVLSFRTHLKTIDTLLQMLDEKVEKIENEMLNA